MKESAYFKTFLLISKARKEKIITVLLLLPWIQNSTPSFSDTVATISFRAPLSFHQVKFIRENSSKKTTSQRKLLKFCPDSNLFFTSLTSENCHLLLSFVVEVI